MSLPQRGYTSTYDPNQDDRTPEQVTRFRRGLRKINIWYGHQFTTTLVLNTAMPHGSENTAPVDQRGWCIFERALSSITKRQGCYLELDGFRGGDLDELSSECRGTQLPPMPPNEFEKLLRDGIASGSITFTNGKDATDICIPQYREGFLRLMAQATHLNYKGLGWGDDEIMTMCNALVYASDYGSLRNLTGEVHLEENEIGDAGLTSLAAVIRLGLLDSVHMVFLYDQRGGRATNMGKMAVMMSVNPFSPRFMLGIDRS